MNKKDIRNFIKYISFSSIWSSLASFAQAITYELTSMHALESSVKIVFALNLDTVSEKLLDSLPFSSAVMANHLSNLVSLE